MSRWFSRISTLAIFFASATASADIVIKNARVIDGTGADVISGATIVVSGNRITSLDGSGASRKALVIDASGKTVMPGMTDHHVHSYLEFWIDPSEAGAGGYPDPSVAITSDAAMAAFRRERLPARLSSFLETGFTSIVDPGGLMPYIVEIRDQIAVGDLVGPRLYVAGRLFTAPKGHPAVTVCNGNEWCIKRLTCATNSTAVARQCARDLVSAGVDGLKLVYDDARSFIPNGVEQLKREVLQAIVDEGHKLGVPVIAHTFTADDSADAVVSGVDGLVHFNFGPKGKLITADGESLPLLLNRFSVPMTTTIRFLDPKLGPANKRQSAQKNVESNVGPSLRALADAGVDLLFGTDYEGIGTPVHPRPLVQSEMRVLLASGFSEHEVIQMLTGNSQKHPFTRKDYGTIEVGQLADIIIVEGDPLEDLMLATQPEVVIKDGGVVIDKR